jgi:surface protein
MSPKTAAKTCAGSLDAKGQCVSTTSQDIQNVKEGDAIKSIDGSVRNKTISSAGLAYQCYFDQKIDNRVDESTALSCSKLDGLDFNASTAVLTWTTTYTQAGSYEFKVSPVSTSGVTHSILAGVIVTNVNRPPVLDSLASVAVASGSAISTINANDGGDDFDIDLEPLTYKCYYDVTPDSSVSTNAECTGISGFTFSNSNAVANWTPTQSQVGIYEIKISATDGTLSDYKVFTITVSSSNRAPVLDSISNQTINENAAITQINAGDSGDDLDSDGDTVTYSCHYDQTINGSVAGTTLCSTLSGLTFNTTTGILGWITTYSQSGSYEFKISGSDGSLTGSKIFSITVNNVNRTPALDAIANQTVSEASAITTIDAADGGDDFDIDEDALTYTCVYDQVVDAAVAGSTSCSAIAGLSFASSTGVLDWTPNYSQSGSYEIKITSSDGSLSSSRIFTITVNDYNPAPTISFTSPVGDDDSVTAMTFFNITFNAADSNDAAAISLYRKTSNTNCADGSLTGWTLITSSLVEGTHTSYSLNTTALESTTQYFCLKIYDGTTAAYAVSDSLVINATGPKFVSTWKTDNAGTSTSTQITLPLSVLGTYNFLVDWGDYQQDTITAYNQAAVTHSYSTAGTYTVTITGTITGWTFANAGDRLKMLTISSWGPFGFGTNVQIFEGAANLTITATDTPSLTGTTSLYRLFKGCSSLTTVPNIGTWNTANITTLLEAFADATLFNSNINAWNTSSVTSLSSTFYNASTFNQPLSSWDTSHVTTFFETFYRASAFNQDISSWNTGLATNFTRMFRAATNFNQNINTWNMSNATNLTYMFYDATSFNQSLNSWNVSQVTNMTSLFYNASSFNGNISNWNTSSVTSFSQMFDGATSFNRDISVWNTASGTVFTYMFKDTSTFNQPIGIWNTSNATNMNGMFQNATAFNQNLNSWDESKVTTFASMFNGATAFNQPLSSWNTSAATSMASMFEGATAFNQSINNFTTTNVTSMYHMFAMAASFNQSLSSWNTSSVTTMALMFQGASSFNQPLSNFNTGNVTTMTQMFDGASAFNQDISGWNTSNVTSFYFMFSNATNFNQNLSAWDTSHVTNMQSMFSSAVAFNGDISTWNTGQVTTMAGMFSSANAFNQNIGNWNTSNVTAMNSMFYPTTSFNQNIGNWDVSKVTTFDKMFRSAFAFNQDLSNWNIAAATVTTQMFFSASSLSTSNYSAILISWSKLNVASSLQFTGGKYSGGTAATRRAYLTGTKLWTITDSGVDANFPSSGAFTAASLVAQTSMTLNWSAGSDAVTPTANLEYFVCTGASAEAIDTVKECLAATQVMNWTANTTSFNVTGLTPGATYYFNVVMRDQANDQVAYDTITQATMP